ncbi:hypothetical protein TSUD_236210 [Trifolium subterraneum]|nr:hypothetical protein TSUD_236210 [Trifolium subterraneum]
MGGGVELKALSVCVGRGIVSRVLWSLHSNVFTIKGVYQTLTRDEEEAEPLLSSTELVWNKVVPVKASVSAWCFMENRIPTSDNLIKRGILNIDAQHCVLGSFDETLSHLFFTCDKTHKVWCGMLQWLGIQSALHNNQVVHVHQFSGYRFIF